MYAGFITSKHTANWLGAHQKFNKVAYRQVVPYVHQPQFPSLEGIQHFEGYNGPDGIKVKSAHRADEPHHFYDPKTEEGPILEYIANHFDSFVKALQESNRVRAAFEASWLSHAITDGMTPAHHYPYHEELHHLYSAGNQQFSKRRHKVLLQGTSRREAMRNNWQMWGSKGLLSTHIHFEMGVAAAVLAGRVPQPLDVRHLQTARRIGVVNFFKSEAEAVYRLKLYERFYKSSWTIGLARQIKHQLAPSIVRVVAISWMLAADEAGITRRN